MAKSYLSCPILERISTLQRPSLVILLPKFLNSLIFPIFSLPIFMFKRLISDFVLHAIALVFLCLFLYCNCQKLSRLNSTPPLVLSRCPLTEQYHTQNVTFLLISFELSRLFSWFLPYFWYFEYKSNKGGDNEQTYLTPSLMLVSPSCPCISTAVFWSRYTELIILLSLYFIPLFFNMSKSLFQLTLSNAFSKLINAIKVDSTTRSLPFWI